MEDMIFKIHLKAKKSTVSVTVRGSDFDFAKVIVNRGTMENPVPLEAATRWMINAVLNVLADEPETRALFLKRLAPYMDNQLTT